MQAVRMAAWGEAEGYDAMLEALMGRQTEVIDDAEALLAAVGG